LISQFDRATIAPPAIALPPAITAVTIVPIIVYTVRPSADAPARSVSGN
jgi:hypothetical protein